MPDRVIQSRDGDSKAPSGGYRSRIGRIRINREIALFVGLYVIYTAARWLVHSRLPTAMANADWVISVERDAHIGIEGSVQHALHFQPVSWLMSNVYLAAQLVVPVIALVFTYRRARPVYIALRNTIIAIWLIAIPVFAVFPVAPPRMAGIGLGEAASHGSAIGLTGHSTIFYNPYAAVPSLHVGVALAVSAALAATARRRWVQVLALLWAPLVTLAVIATGNHYVFDVVTGALTAATGYALGRGVNHLVNARAGAGVAVPARVTTGTIGPLRPQSGQPTAPDLLPVTYRAESQMGQYEHTLVTRGEPDDSANDDDRADVRWLGRVPERRSPARPVSRHRRALAGAAVPERDDQPSGLIPEPLAARAARPARAEGRDLGWEAG